MVKNDKSSWTERFTKLFKRDKTSNSSGLKRSDQTKQTIDSQTYNRSESIVERLVKNENCKTVEIGWYKSMDLTDHTGIVLEIDKKNQWAIDFDLPKRHQQVDLSAISENGSVTIRKYDKANSSFQNALIVLNRNDLTKFVEYCISDEVSQSKQQNCWTFVFQTIEHLRNKISQDTMSSFSEKLSEIISFNEQEHVRKIQKELQNEACNWSEIGFYQRHDFDFGLVIQINENNTLAIDYVTGQDLNKEASSCSANYDTSGIESVAYSAKITSYNNPNSRFVSTFTKLNATDLINFVDFCIRRNRSKNSWDFVYRSFQFLYDENKITEPELRHFSNQLVKTKANEHKYIKKIKAEMLRENCEEVEIGWYKSNDVMGHTGVVLSFDRNKVFVIDFDIFSDDAYEELSSAPDEEKVTMGSYNCSNVEFETALAKLNKNEVINFVVEFCLPYGKDNKEKQQNCWTFVLDAFQHLNSKGKVTQEKMKTFSSQLRKIIAINKKII